MRAPTPRLLRAALVAIAAFTLVACAQTAPGTPVPPGPDGSASAPPAPVPTGPEAQAALAGLPMPSAASPVLAIATVLETADGAILCVGAVAESAPPQCGGPALVGWDWASFEHQETGGVRWVQGVAVEGTYDADEQTFTQTGAPMSAAAITVPAQADLATLQRADVLGSWGEQGTVVLNVIYDDGSVQAAVDAIYGEGVVFVIPALR